MSNCYLCKRKFGDILNEENQYLREHDIKDEKGSNTTTYVWLCEKCVVKADTSTNFRIFNEITRNLEERANVLELILKGRRKEKGTFRIKSNL
jgi:hypothetical protein